MEEGRELSLRAEMTRRSLRKKYSDSALKIRRTEISKEENRTIKGQMSEWNAARLLPETMKTMPLLLSFVD